MFKRQGVAFRRILDEVRGTDRAEPAPAAGRASFANPLARAAPPIAERADRSVGASPRWDQAWAFVDDLDAPGGDPAARDMPGDHLEALARELGLCEARDRKDLRRIRRRFMWLNHPDRRPDLPREFANRRVALANMLIDRALRALVAGPPGA
jgi:hypothetical protein